MEKINFSSVKDVKEYLEKVLNEIVVELQKINNKVNELEKQVTEHDDFFETLR